MSVIIVKTSKSAVFTYTQSMEFEPGALEKLKQNPCSKITTAVDNSPVTVQFGIPHYRKNLSQHYKLPEQQFSDFQHFGLVITFDSATEIAFHDNELRLPVPVSKMTNQFGPIIIHNTFLPESISSIGHRNRFPHLNFHRDRNDSQPTPISLFYRNPFDEEQTLPRTSSTLFISNQHARAQLVNEGDTGHDRENLAHCMLFTKIDKTELSNDYFGKLILEQKWDKDQGTGEICIQDNRHLLHASYYRTPRQDGYRIGVRYLSQ